MKEKILLTNMTSIKIHWKMLRVEFRWFIHSSFTTSFDHIRSKTQSLLIWFWQNGIQRHGMLLLQ